MAPNPGTILTFEVEAEEAGMEAEGCRLTGVVGVWACFWVCRPGGLNGMRPTGFEPLGRAMAMNRERESWELDGSLEEGDGEVGDMKVEVLTAVPASETLRRLSMSGVDGASDSSHFLESVSLMGAPVMAEWASPGVRGSSSPENGAQSG